MTQVTTYHTRLKALPAENAGDLATKAQVDAAVAAQAAATTKVRVIGATEDPATANIPAGTVVFRRIT